MPIDSRKRASGAKRPRKSADGTNSPPKAKRTSRAKKPRKSTIKVKSPPKASAETKRAPRITKPAKLLSGGNPQIAKGDGDAPVQAYIAGMPGWKRDVGRRLDALIARSVPHVQKAVKWNSPFYGTSDHGWFLGVHCYTNYVKLAFFSGASLKPVPPGESKHKDVRYLDIHEGDTLDEAQLVTWVQQSAALPGWRP